MSLHSTEYGPHQPQTTLAAMEYDYRRHQSGVSFVFPNYYAHERNAPLALSQVSRVDPRTCPIGGPNGGMRTRGGAMREEEIQENSGNSRRRIAVACARCRKRKIRCSGDPGNGSGCTNCKQAGIDMNQCQFHRVGTVPTEAVYSTGLGGGLLNMGNHNTPIPLYSTNGSPIYPRIIPTAQYAPHIDTKTVVYPQTWTVPCSEDTSPVETYGLDQPNGYIPQQTAMTNAYGHSYRWSQYQQRALENGTTPYIEQNGSTSYTGSAGPFLQTATLRPTVSTEPMSPLNMTSIQSALPTSVTPRKQSDSAITLRQLPEPKPSPDQPARNNLDLLQDQRLRSNIPTTSMSMKESFVKPIINWNSDSPGSDLQNTPASDVSAVDLDTLNPTSGPITNNDVMGYVPITTSSTSQSVISATQARLNFSAGPLLDAIPTPVGTTTYSNFHNYALPTSSSTDSHSLLARQPSQTSLYSFSPDSAAKRNSLSGSSHEAALVSGQRYTPLDQSPEVRHSSNLDNKPMLSHHSSIQI